MEVNKQKLLKIIEEADNCMEYHAETTDKPEYYSFKLEAITDKNPVYRALSDIVYNADVSTNFAYQMVAEAIDALEYIISNEDETVDTDNLSEQIAEQADSNLPIYNSEIMEFVGNNPYSVNNAIKEMGKAESLIQDGQMAYYLEWEKIAYEVLSELTELINE